MRVSPNSVQCTSLPKGKSGHTQGSPCEDTRRPFSPKQGEVPGRLLPPGPSEGANPANNLISGSWPPELGHNKFPLSKPPSWWHFVTTALGNPYSSHYWNLESGFFFKVKSPIFKILNPIPSWRFLQNTQPPRI